AGIVTMATDGVTNACKWVFPYAPLWVPSMLIRAAKTDVLQEIFNRPEVGGLSETEVKSLGGWIVPAVRSALESPATTDSSESFSGRLLKELGSLLSILTIRIRGSELDEILNLAIEIHARARADRSLHDVSKRFF